MVSALGGALAGVLCDKIGRRASFILFAIGSFALGMAYTMLPITDAAMQERYRRDYAGKPGPEEALIRVIGVPKTIDNDIQGTTSCFGFDTAVAFATENETATEVDGACPSVPVGVKAAVIAWLPPPSELVVTVQAPVTSRVQVPSGVVPSATTVTVPTATTPSPVVTVAAKATGSP